MRTLLFSSTKFLTGLRRTECPRHTNLSNVLSATKRFYEDSLSKADLPPVDSNRQAQRVATQLDASRTASGHHSVSQIGLPTDKDILAVSRVSAITLGLAPLAFLMLHPDAASALTPSDLTNAAVETVTASGWLGPALFVVLYAAATVFLFPASVLTLAAGAVFGPLAGFALVSLASTTGATCAFLVSRYVARPWVERKIQGLPRFKAVLSGVAAHGPWVVFLLRLSPLVPFNLLNYALGLTPVRLGPYVAASWAGMLPGTFAYVYLGGAGRAAVDAAASGGAALSTTQLVMYGVGAVATLLATRAISSAASKALAEQQGVDDAGAGADPGSTDIGADKK